MKVPQYSRTAVSLLLLGVALALSACGTAKEKAARRAQTAERALERTQQLRIRIPIEPTHLRYDYAHPLFTVRQSFMWGPYDHEWRLMIVDHTAEYAGFFVKIPFDLPAQREGMVLLFELWPPEAAHSLALGLIDGSMDHPAQFPALPIAAYEITRWQESNLRTFAIPLIAFETSQLRRSKDGHFETVDHAPNWNSIRGIHLLRLVSAPAHARQIIIRNMQFAPYLWVREMRADFRP